MITYKPSYISFTPKKKTDVITISGLDENATNKSNLEIVVFKRSGDNLSERICTFSSMGEFAAVNEVKNDLVTVSFTINDDISAELKRCFLEKNETIGIRLTASSSIMKGQISTMQQVLIPIFDSSAGNSLTAERTNAVLGELSATLRITNLTCSKTYFFSRDAVTCNAVIVNASNYNVLTNLVVSLRDGFPPGTTIYSNFERTNLLLLPGQSFSLDFPLPSDKYVYLRNNVSLHATFASIGSDSTGFDVQKESSFWFVPVVWLIVVLSLLVVFSAILIRRIVTNFKKRKHGG